MNHPRGGFTAQITRKRKERDDFFINTINGSNNMRGKQVQLHPPHPRTTSFKQKPAEPVCSNRLLAGYLAHEFLTQGTLLGQKFNPARAEAVPFYTPAELKKKPAPPVSAERSNGGSLAVGGVEPSGTPTPTPTPVQQNKSYDDVASLLKTDGAHIPGIVNPTQLARWIQM